MNVILNFFSYYNFFQRLDIMHSEVILQEEDIQEKIESIVREIVESHLSFNDVVLVGIRTGGAYLAARFQRAISRITGQDIPMGVLDITLYRDDWTRIGPSPRVGKTELPFSIDDKTVILVDDVLFTGRTVRAAMDALMDYGRPKRIELAILVDRGHQYRELPICSNYVGIVWPTTPEQTINVYLTEAGFADHVRVEEKK